MPRALLLALLIGCDSFYTKPEPTDSEPDPSTDTTETDVEPLETDETDASDDTDPTDAEDTDTEPTDPPEDTAPPAPVWSCANQPTGNLGERTMSHARAWHGLAFDDAGFLLGWDGNRAIVKSEYAQNRQVYIPGVFGLEQFDRLPNGDYVVGDSFTGSLLRIDAQGSVTTIAANLTGIYGVTTGPDGNVYVVHGDVSRVDPATGTVERLLRGRQRTYHSLNFNLDSTIMYLGTIGTDQIWAVPLDPKLDPLADPQPFARIAGSGWIDAVGVDACGNVYVADYYTSGLYRIDPRGNNVTRMARRQTIKYGHGLMWGTGLGGWRVDALYQPQPYNGATVREVIVGLPNGDTVRTWNGVPAPW